MPRALLKPTKPIISAIILAIGVFVSVYIILPSSSIQFLQKVINSL